MAVGGTGVNVAVGKGVGMAVGDTGINVAVGKGVGVAEGGILVGMDGTSVAFAVAVGGALVGLGLGGVGFVGSGLGGSFVGDGSTSTLATTLDSGVRVSAI